MKNILTDDVVGRRVSQWVERDSVGWNSLIERNVYLIKVIEKKMFRYIDANSSSQTRCSAWSSSSSWDLFRIKHKSSCLCLVKYDFILHNSL